MKFLNRFRRKSSEPDPVATPAQDKPAHSVHSPETKQPVTPKKAQPNPDELRFELGDFLHRIPAHLLQSGPHDLKTEICFEIKDLSDRISKGQTTISLAEIYKRVPQIFRGQILDTDNIEVRFPWQKLARLVNSVRAGSKHSSAFESQAEALAQKLRQKKNTPDTTAPAASHHSPSVLPGIGGKESVWFSKPTLERPLEKAHTPTHPPAAPDPAPVVEAATLVAPKNEEPPAAPGLKLATHESPAAQSTKSSQDDVIIAELPADIARRVAVIKGDYERQLAELDRQRKIATETREQQTLELDKLRLELEQARLQITDEKTVSAASRDLLQKTAQERQTIQDELNAKQKELDETQARIAQLNSETAVGSLTAERDALLQQKAYLSMQVAEVSKRGQQSKHGESGSGASMGAQRQVEELQRRIGTLEASQRENAHIIAREKELRSKAEKLLASAEKLQEQSANHMESAKTEMRKEIETSVRLRENEARKAQKELQDQLTALSDQTRKTAVELENERARVAELQAQLEAARAVVAPQPDPFQAQLVTQLESDIENYRDRLKALIRERDAARSEAEKSASLPDAEIQKLIDQKSKLESELRDIRKLQQEQAEALEDLQQQRANDQQRAEEERATHEKRASSLLQSINSAQQALSEKRATLEPILAETKAELENMRAQYNELAEKLQHEREVFEKERHQNAANLREQGIALEQQLAILVHERDQLQRDKDALSARIKSESEAREDLISGLDREHTSVVRANEELTRRLADTERALRELEKEKDNFANSGAAMLGDPALQAEVNELNARLASALAERDQAQISAKSRDDALQESEVTLKRLAADQHQIVSQINEEQAKNQRLQSELETLQSEYAAQLKIRDRDSAAEKENLLDQLSTEKEITSRISGQLPVLEAELTKLIEQHKALKQAHAGTVAEKQKLEETLATLEQQNRGAISELSKERDAIADALKTARAEHERAIAKLESERQFSARVKEDADLEIARLRKEISATAEAFAENKRTSDEEIAMLSKAKAALDEQSRLEIEKLKKTANEIQSIADAAREAQRAAEEALATAKAKHNKDAAAIARALDGHQKIAEAAKNELAASKKAQEEIAASLERKSAEFSAKCNELQAMQSALKETEQQLLEVRSTSERNTRELEQKLAGALETNERKADELEKMRAAIASARRDCDELTQRAAIDKSGLRQQLDALASEKQSLASEFARERESLSRNASALNENLSQTKEELAKARHDLDNLQAERENLARQRDELARRLTRITDELGIAPPTSAPEPVRPSRTHQATPPVIEVLESEIVFPERENSVTRPRIRPVPVAPPRVGSH